MAEGSPNGVSLKHVDAPPITPWERVQLARHADRPHTLDFVQLVFSDFVEMHGDRLFAEDGAIVGGLASLDGRTVVVIGHQKGRGTKDNVLRHFGISHPEGNRKALRLMHHAEKFGLPLITLVDTSGADPSLPSEERGQAFAIAENILVMSRLRVPCVTVITGEGGSGGALALAVADRVYMFENAIYSVAAPEAAASILWRDSARGAEAAAALKITAQDILRFGIVDAIIPEPPGGAQTDHTAAAQALHEALTNGLESIRSMPIEDLLRARAERYRSIGIYDAG